MIWQVTGYDDKGRELFSQETDAPNGDVAKMYVCAELRRTANGTALVNSADRVEANPSRGPKPPTEAPGARVWRRDARQKRNDRR